MEHLSDGADMVAKVDGGPAVGALERLIEPANSTKVGASRLEQLVKALN